MNALSKSHSALSAPTQYAETGGRRLAYRQFGDGPPIVLCLRFRGVMDVWDPAFLDALAQNFTVIIFDYSGLGLSTGEASYNRRRMAQDVKDLIDALALDKVIIGGWSLGGIAAQIFAALHPERVSHVVLIGTTPPGPQPFQAEPIFLPTAMKPVNTLEDEYILFFEPNSPKSRAAAAASHERIARRELERSPAIAEAVFLKLLRESHNPEATFPDDNGYAARLGSGGLPILMISGDHDVVFPVENWYVLTRKWPSLTMLVFPQAGHGPQQQYPEQSAAAITSFVREAN